MPKLTPAQLRYMLAIYNHGSRKYTGRALRVLRVLRGRGFVSLEIDRATARHKSPSVKATLAPAGAAYMENH